MKSDSSLADHERLDVWQKAMLLLVECYKIASMLPVEERYGLASQIRRSAVSVPANIAEACGRFASGDKLRFLAIASGSLAELGTLLVACERLSYVHPDDLRQAKDLLVQTRQLLGGLSRYERRRKARANGSRVPGPGSRS